MSVYRSAVRRFDVLVWEQQLLEIQVMTPGHFEKRSKPQTALCRSLSPGQLCSSLTRQLLCHSTPYGPKSSWELLFGEEETQRGAYLMDMSTLSIIEQRMHAHIPLISCSLRCRAIASPAFASLVCELCVPFRGSRDASPTR